MDRRDFLKASALFMAAGAVLPNAVKSMFASRLNNEAENFSLEVITGNSGLASKLLEDFIKSGNLGKGTFSYSEYPVSGYVMGDLVFVRDNNLIDYTQSDDDLSSELKEIRKKLSLPSILSNPVRLRIYRNSGTEVKKIIAAQKGKIISKIDSDDSKLYTFYGKSGNLVLDVSSGGARVKDVFCRHKICRQMSSIKKPGDYIICIPNELQFFAE